MTLYSPYLAHFGVKGMKWGVRHERKYERRERRASKFDKKAEEYQREIDKRNEKGKKATSRGTKKLEKKKQRALKDAKAVREGKLTRNQKLLIAGAAVVAAYATYKAVDSGQVRAAMLKGQKLLGKDISFEKNSEFSKKMSSDEIFEKVSKGINPDFNKKAGTTNNCRRCTFAYEMRRRGYDVKATRSISATGQSATGLWNATHAQRHEQLSTSTPVAIGSIYKETIGSIIRGKDPGTGKYTEAALSESKRKIAGDVFDFLKSNQPDGARGELNMTWKMGSGHSIAYEIVNGNPILIDNQSHKMFKNAEEFSEYSKQITELRFTRLDNIELNEEFLRRWIENA